MTPIIRLANASDAPQWLELLRSCLGSDYPDKEIYTTERIVGILDASSGDETWIAEAGGRILSSITLLKPQEYSSNPVLNLGRNLHRLESYGDGAAEMLLRKINELAAERGHLIIARVPASDNPQQILFENAGYVCVGFQPLKHILHTRQGMLFYVLSAKPPLAARSQISESLPQISELATLALEGLKIPNPLAIRDGATGYPLHTDLKVAEASFEDFELWRMQAQTSNPIIEVSTGSNCGLGFLRLAASLPIQALLGERESQIVAGIAYIVDEQDHCVRIIDSFATDDLSTGAMFQHVLRLAHEQHGAAYVEVDILAAASRLLKSTEQMGFVPIAYFPAFFAYHDGCKDVVKLIKLNIVYSPETAPFTTQATAVARLVDQNFQDQKIGVAIISLLRALPIFDGLGDGELRKIARLFSQKLYRPGEKVFNRGDAGSEAYIVMRGQIDICLNEEFKPIASLGNGQIFGELAFLDGSARTALAVASQASILLVVQRTAFNDLVQREPHLGMVVMRNIAQDLSNKLRKANASINTVRK